MLKHYKRQLQEDDSGGRVLGKHLAGRETQGLGRVLLGETERESCVARDGRILHQMFHHRGSNCQRLGQQCDAPVVYSSPV